MRFHFDPGPLRSKSADTQGPYWMVALGLCLFVAGVLFAL
ncbi:hypothetical protein SAMN02745126_05040 [Enhydrobacter aerosaccus]|uniref:Uncharacterized protein n=1 Tax=Enhydrobacter aerosaccus TaxID=225324 RepID=A0A1T4SRI8_9HYPH|nr:hypothetical protein SAMN02745126_05040 [Enhydrobacter aerosaccus]